MTTNAKTTALLLASTFFVAALAGCMVQTDQTEEDGSSSGYGTIAFFVKDAPADELSEFYVTFSKVDVHQAGGDDEADDERNETEAPEGNETEAPEGNETLEGNETAPEGNETVGDDADESEESDESESADSRWIVVVNTTHTVNLKNFTGDARAFLGNASVPEGTYTQIRIHVDEAWGILAEDGSRVEVMVPSDALRIVRPWSVEANDTTELTVDFILEKSLIKAGQSGKWIFKPVMKLAIDHVEGEDNAPNERRGPPEGNETDARDENAGGPPGNETAGPPENPGSQGRP